jgi:hypothetical protein
MGLFHGFHIDIDGCNEGLRTTLGKHQGNETGAGTDVQYPMGTVDVGPSAQQYTVCAYFHGAAVVTDGELFEGEIRICHACHFLIGPKNTH